MVLVLYNTNTPVKSPGGSILIAGGPRTAINLSTQSIWGTVFARRHAWNGVPDSFHIAGKPAYFTKAIGTAA